MLYASITDVLARYDNNRIGDLVTDTGVRVPASALPANVNLQACLIDACGEIDAACRAGMRYTQTDMQNIANGYDPLNPQLDMTNSQALLKRLVSDLTYGLLVSRRGYVGEDATALAPRYKEALALLEVLRNGGRVFVTTRTQQAGIPDPGILIAGQIPQISSNSRFFGTLTNPTYPTYNPKVL